MDKNIIFKALVGSHSYGTNVEGSDEDYKGIYLQSPEDVLNNGYQEQYTVNKDETYYELRRFIELCATGNPTMLELLYSPKDCIEYIHPVFEELMLHRDKFLTKSCKHSFGGYAFSQIKKADGLEKKMNWESSRVERKDILDFCYRVDITLGRTEPMKVWLARQKGWMMYQQNYGLVALDHARDTYAVYRKENGEYRGICNEDLSGNDIRLSSIPEGEFPVAIMNFNKDGYSVHCSDYLQYQTWLKNRNTQRYVDTNNHGQMIDGKNLLHCYRLIETGIEIATQKTINVRRPNAEFLIGIRKGKYNLQELLDGANSKLDEMYKVFETSDLPEKCDRGFFLGLLPKLRNKYYEKEKAIS